MIPHPVRIYDRDRPVLADSKTVGLRAVNISAPRKPEFFKPVLQEIPGSQSDLLRATLGLGLITAQENVTLRRAYSECSCDHGKLAQIYILVRIHGGMLRGIVGLMKQKGDTRKSCAARSVGVPPLYGIEIRRRPVENCLFLSTSCLVFARASKSPLTWCD